MNGRLPEKEEAVDGHVGLDLAGRGRARRARVRWGGRDGSGGRSSCAKASGRSTTMSSRRPATAARPSASWPTGRSVTTSSRSSRSRTGFGRDTRRSGGRSRRASSTSRRPLSAKRTSSCSGSCPTAVIRLRTTSSVAPPMCQSTTPTWSRTFVRVIASPARATRSRSVRRWHFRSLFAELLEGGHDREEVRS